MVSVSVPSGLASWCSSFAHRNWTSGYPYDCPPLAPRAVGESNDMSPGAARCSFRYMATRAPVTPRQAEVIERVARGLTTKEIAAALGVSERAVTAQLSRLMTKFAVPNRAGLIAAVMSSETRLALPSADLARVYENAPFMVAVTLGPEHRFTFVNRMSAEVSGRPAETLKGKTVRELYPDLDPSFAAALDAVYRTGVPWAAERADVVWTHPDGTTRRGKLNLMFHPLRDAAGAIVGLLHIGAEP